MHEEASLQALNKDQLDLGTHLLGHSHGQVFISCRTTVNLA